MSLNITCKNARDVRQLSDVAVAAARAKFFSECGVSLDDVGGIVIDEVSFITAAVFGHVDHVLRAMTGNLDVPCGGVPILLCGDNHQKPPPGDSFWYKELVESLPGVVIKSKRGDAGTVVGTYNARACGIKLLKSARKVWSWSGSCEPQRCTPRLERTTHLSQPSDATAFFCGDRIYHSSECNSACAIRLRSSHQSVQPF